MIFALNTHSLSLSRASGHSFFVRADDSSLINSMRDDATWELYFRPASIGLEQDLISVWRPGDNRRTFRLYITSDNRLALDLSADGTAVVSNTSDVLSLSPGTFIHLAAVRNSTTGLISFYADGVAVGTGIAGLGGQQLFSNPATTNLVVGAQDGLTTSSADGLINNIRLWSGQRTLSELADNRNQVEPADDTALVAHWPCRDLGRQDARNSAINPTPTYYPTTINLRSGRRLASTNGGTFSTAVPFDGSAQLQLDQPVLVGRAVAGATTQFQTSFTVTLPSGVQDGDLLVVCCGAADSTGDWSFPAGYAHVPGSPLKNSFINSDISGAILTKVAAGEGATIGPFLLSSTAGPVTSVEVLVFRTLSSTPVAAGASQARVVAETSAHPSVTVPADGAVLLGYTLTNRAALNPDPGGAFVEVGDFVQEYNSLEASPVQSQIQRAYAAAGASPVFLSDGQFETGTAGDTTLNADSLQFTVALARRAPLSLTTPVSFCIADADGNPIEGASPVFLSAFNAQTLLAIALPTIEESINGVYAFEDNPLLTGMIDCGTNAVPRYRFVLPDTENSFPVYDSAGAPLTGLSPTMERFVVLDGQALPALAITELGDGVYAFPAPSPTEVEAVEIATGGDIPENYCLEFSPAGAIDVNPPVVSNVSPPSGTQLASQSTPVQFDVTDLNPGLQLVLVTVKFAGRVETQVAYDGTNFLPPFNGPLSQTTAIANGLNFVIDPAGRWLGDIEELFVYAIDSAGNLEGLPT